MIRIFSLDTRQGYHQIPVCHVDIENSLLYTRQPKIYVPRHAIQAH